MTDKRKEFEDWFVSHDKDETGGHYSSGTRKNYCPFLEMAGDKLEKAGVPEDRRKTFPNNYFSVSDIARARDCYGRVIELREEGFTLGELPAALKLYIQFLEQQKVGNCTNEICGECDVSLNSILYGPPGTGKTFHTVPYAVAICENESVEDITEEYENEEAYENGEAVEKDSVRGRYRKLVEAGRIVFVTFHQSYSYEDFIEGIKPIMNDEDMAYTIEDGVFKRLCNANHDFDEAWGKLIDEVAKAEEEEESGNLSIPTIGNSKLGLATSQTGLKRINKDGATLGYFNKTQCKNVYQGRPGVPQGGHDNYRKAIVAYMEKKLGLKPYSYGEDVDNRVIIIDEINRGNISRIFGELITLIEEDKRLGGREPRKVVLPYSKTEFGVPSNVYILGTMNTADRSLTQIDTALRRRFSFVEMMPDPKKLKVIDCEGTKVDLREMLTAMNVRIEALLDRDHTIGHSYFMKVEGLDDLKAVFRDKIIPLLQEYFYDDYENIRKVLGDGDGFIREKQGDKYLDVIEDRSRKIYEFTQSDDWETGDFVKIYDRSVDASNDAEGAEE